MKFVKFCIFVLVLFLTACFTSNKVATTDLSFVYEKETNFIDFEYSVFHTSDSISTFYYSLNTSSLLFVKPLNKNIFSANYAIRFELFTKKNQKVPVDTFSMKFVDSLNYGKNIDLTDSVKIKAFYPEDYFLIITINDKNKSQKYNYIYNLNKSDRNSRQNFIAINESGLPVLKNSIDINEKYTLRSNNTLVKELFVFYHKRDFPIAQPPFVETREQFFAYKCDSIFKINISDGVSSQFDFYSKGLYHVQFDTLQKEGITLYHFNNDFPEIKTPLQMLSPLKYITTKAEFNELAAVKNIKEAVDGFWLDKAGNSDRAKELIRKFYGRVKNANVYFTSYLEGWKTDRGMIYIVFGQPNFVYRSTNVETWIYGEENNILSLSFNFNKISNPFSDNDYSLVREAGYKDSWYAAIETWRK